MTECRCREDGGDYCYAKALKEAEAMQDGGETKAGMDPVKFVEWLNKSRRASNVPYHVVDEATLQQIAHIITSAPHDSRTPEERKHDEARAEAERQLRLLEKQRQRLIAAGWTPPDDDA